MTMSTTKNARCILLNAFQPGSNPPSAWRPIEDDSLPDQSGSIKLRRKLSANVGSYAKISMLPSARAGGCPVVATRSDKRTGL